MKCIICNEEKTESKEHIIPKAMGNDNFITNRVCRSCNNKLGSYVDNYFINHLIIKIIRKDRNWVGESGIPIKLFPSNAVDKVSGKHFLFRDDKPIFLPEAILENDVMHVEASSLEEGMKIARKKLDRMGFSAERIEEILKNCSLSEKQTIKPEFSFPANIEWGRFGLAIVKIAYEYTHRCLGDSYLENETARVIRQELFKSIYHENDISINNNNDFIKYHFIPCNEDMLHIVKNCSEGFTVPIRHCLILHKTPDKQLVCDIFLGLINIISFSVLMAEKMASDYLREQMYITLIFDDSSIIDVSPENLVESNFSDK